MKKDYIDTAKDKVNHDIKSSVMSIKAYTQLLLKKADGSLDEKTYNYIVRLDKQVDTLIKLMKGSS